ncbi:MAG: hypothetical protein H0X47_07675, partial [Nitrospirales bacterium]|nr:hypothetical protein [Nitrospirales bacterium]
MWEKSSLVLHLPWQLILAGPSPKSPGPLAVYCDVADQADRQRFMSRPQGTPTVENEKLFL